MSKRPPLHELSPSSVLVVLPTWVGDYVMATPALRALRARFPHSRMVLLGDPNLRPLAEGNPWMDEWIDWSAKRDRNPLARSFRKLVGRLRRERFDLAVLLPNSFRAAAMAWLAGARRRVGYDRDGRGWLLTDRIAPTNLRDGRFQPMPLVEHYAELIRPLGCDHPGHDLKLATSPAGDAVVEQRLARLGIAARRPLVVISPGARYGASKLWESRGFAAVGDRLVEKYGAAVVVTCGPGEEGIALSIGVDMEQSGHVLHDPLLSLGELKSLIARADLMLCTDAGPRHIAKAFGKPVVAVFGPTHPEWTSTNYPLERIVRIDVDCGPCQQRVCPLGHHKCMRDLPAQAVLAAAEELLVATRDGASVRTAMPIVGGA